jgi:hypothetical protein
MPNSWKIIYADDVHCAEPTCQSLKDLSESVTEIIYDLRFTIYDLRLYVK